MGAAGARGTGETRIPGRVSEVQQDLGREVDVGVVSSGWVGAPPADVAGLVRGLESEMRKAASELRYEEAALLRDEIAEMRLALAEEAVGFVSGTPVVDG